MTLTMDIAPDISNIVVDVNEFKMALVNLVINARDAMAEGGLVTITARNARRGIMLRYLSRIPA